MRLLSRLSVNTVVARVGALLNRMSPLDRLADDILVLVFQRLDNRAKFFAAKVSRRWRALALSVPSLWATIDLSCQLREFEKRFLLLVNRSGDAPLDITLFIKSKKVKTIEAGYGEDYEETIQLLQQCETDLGRQLQRRIQRLVLAPNVLRRTRTLDITSFFDFNHYVGSSVEMDELPTQQLCLAASPSLQRLRLDWGRPASQYLVLDPPTDQCTFNSVSTLALYSVTDLRIILPRFGGVVDLSLRAVDDDTDIELADICAWMPRLLRLEIIDVPENFASKPILLRPSLKRLVLHGEYVRNIFAEVVNQLDFDTIPMVILCSLASNSFRSDFIRNPNPLTAELSVIDYNGNYGMESSVWGPRACYYFCVDDGLGNIRVLHSTHQDFEDCFPEIVTFATININMGAFAKKSLNTMPLLTTLRLQAFVRTFHSTDLNRGTPVSCPVLAHLELYFVQPRRTVCNDRDDHNLAGQHILKWVTNNLTGFTSPLQTLRVVGARVLDDDGVLNKVSHAVFFAPSPLVEYVAFFHCHIHSQNYSESAPQLAIHSLIRYWRRFRLSSNMTQDSGSGRHDVDRFIECGATIN